MLLEAICVILLLAALGLGVRLALRPAHARLEETAAALADHESRTRAVLDAMDEGMLLFARDGSLLDSNPSAQRILGIDRTRAGRDDRRHGLAALVTARTGFRIRPETLPSLVTLRTGEPHERAVCSAAARRRRGAVALGEHAPDPARAGRSMPYACLSVFRDVTDERQLEEERAAQAQAQELQNQELLEQAEALERGQALFRSLVDTAGSAIVGVRMDGSRVRVEPRGRGAVRRAARRGARPRLRGHASRRRTTARRSRAGSTPCSTGRCCATSSGR